jgi:tRNA(Ile2) C34 agmatinyltransferase TiaS
MQFLAQLSAKLFFCVGIMITVVSCVVGSVVGSGLGTVPFMGIALMTIGAVLWHKTSTKICPGCAERVKSQARKCQYCGADLAG